VDIGNGQWEDEIAFHGDKMSRVYLMDDGSKTVELKRIHCKDEDKELQSLLEHNPNLLPGDQIDPEEPRKWILIKREMPVTDPSTGVFRWSIDFFFTDQFGVPTFVECKRCEDSQARRQVVGQMLEYAANGRFYWKEADLRETAARTHAGVAQLEAKVKEVCGVDEAGHTVATLFSAIEQNLQQAKMRLIFFLDESPLELRSIVEFLNDQMKETEVLIVEARQYESGDKRIVVPWVFGFTEQARVAKQESRAQTMRTSAKRGPDAFWEAVHEQVSEESIQPMESLMKACSDVPGCKIGYAVSCLFFLSDILPNRALFSMRRDGSLQLLFGYWTASEYPNVTDLQQAVRVKFAAGLEKILGIQYPLEQQNKYPTLAYSKWAPHWQALAELTRKLGSPQETQ
jgi:hypothetical protein